MSWAGLAGAGAQGPRCPGEHWYHWDSHGRVSDRSRAGKVWAEGLRAAPGSCRREKPNPVTQPGFPPSSANICEEDQSLSEPGAGRTTALSLGAHARDSLCWWSGCFPLHPTRLSGEVSWDFPSPGAAASTATAPSLRTSSFWGPSGDRAEVPPPVRCWARWSAVGVSVSSALL